MRKYIRKLPKKWKIFLRHLVFHLGYLLSIVLSKIPFGIRIYVLFNSSFMSEARSFLFGKIEYNKNLHKPSMNSALLRRNIHRLEKGLIMPNRRNVFAEDFISETVEIFRILNTTNDHDLNESKWACDILNEYFSVVGSTEIIDKARNKYASISKLNHTSVKRELDFPLSDGKCLPYVASKVDVPTIGISQLKEMYERRRSVRWYTKDEVEVEKIDVAVALASSAPSACNRQSFTFHYVSGSEKITKITNVAGGAGGFNKNIPGLIAVVGDFSSYWKEQDRHLIYVDAALATMQLILGFQAQGLSSCSINWPDKKTSNSAAEKLLGLSVYERVIMLVAVGYADPASFIPYSQKKESKLLKRHD